MYRYIGAGAGEPHDKRGFLPGIPARDITEEEAKAKGWESELKASPAYKRSNVKAKEGREHDD